MQTKRAVSAGGVVYRDNKGKIEVVIASRHAGRPAGRQASGKGEQVWCLPKGEVEEGESLAEAASREVREETGLSGEVVEKIDQIDYWFYWKPEDTRYHKFVHFFLFKFVSGSTKDHDFELDEVKWVPIDKAPKLLSYKSEKEVVAKAQAIIKS